LTATVIGLSVASYSMLKKRSSQKKIATTSTENDDDKKYKAKHTTRHGSHLTKTTGGISGTEEDIKAEAK
jgi:hypothetical protein